MRLYNSVFLCSAAHGEDIEVKCKCGCGRHSKQSDSASKKDEKQAKKAAASEIPMKKKVGVAKKYQQPL